MTTAAVVGSALALVGIFAVLAGAIAYVARPQQVRTEPQAPLELGDIKSRLAALELAVKELPDIYERAAQRAEDASEQAAKRLRSARAAESRARRAAESPDGDDDDEEALELFGGDEGAGGRAGVQHVQPAMAGDPSEDLARRAVAAGWSPLL